MELAAFSPNDLADEKSRSEISCDYQFYDMASLLPCRTTSRLYFACYLQAATRSRCRSRVLEAQHLAVVVVGEELGVAAPVDDRLEQLVGLLLVEMVLELPLEPRLGGAVAGALVEDAAD